MKRFHVHVAVHDLDQSVRFYSTLFGTAPAVKKDDYAKWMLDDPRVNFAISARAGKNRDRSSRHANRDLGRARGGWLAPRPGRCLPAAAKRRIVLLCEERQVLDHRPTGHRLGVVSHTGLYAALWQR